MAAQRDADRGSVIAGPINPTVDERRLCGQHDREPWVLLCPHLTPSLLDILMSLTSLKVLQMLAALWNIEAVEHNDEGDNMGSFRTKVIHFASFFAAVVTVANTASATSGPGCLRVVNVESWDVLNIRASASANSEIVDELQPSRHGVISLDGECGPVSLPWASRWCPITHYNGDRTTRGYVKARYVRDAECP